MKFYRPAFLTMQKFIYLFIDRLKCPYCQSGVGVIISLFTRCNKVYICRNCSGNYRIRRKRNHPGFWRMFWMISSLIFLLALVFFVLANISNDTRVVKIVKIGFVILVFETLIHGIKKWFRIFTYKTKKTTLEKGEDF